MLIVPLICIAMCNYLVLQPHQSINQFTPSFWTPSVGEIVLAFFSTLPLDTPVDPNPPTPRSVSVNSSTCTAGTMEICSRINWAMRSPMETSKSSEPKLKRTTPTFPRSVFCYVIQYCSWDRFVCWLRYINSGEWHEPCEHINHVMCHLIWTYNRHPQLRRRNQSSSWRQVHCNN